jgi:hypothetical protein
MLSVSCAVDQLPGVSQVGIDMGTARPKSTKEDLEQAEEETGCKIEK